MAEVERRARERNTERGRESRKGKRQSESVAYSIEGFGNLRGFSRYPPPTPLSGGSTHVAEELSCSARFWSRRDPVAPVRWAHSQDLKDFMRQAGEVTFADAHRPKLNEGVVEFASHSDLKNALEKLSGKEINGRKIKLIEAARKKSRTRSRSNSCSRSRSRSRSRSPSRSSKSHHRSRSRSSSASPSPVQRAKEAKRTSRAESASPVPAAQRTTASRSPSTDSRH